MHKALPGAYSSLQRILTQQCIVITYHFVPDQVRYTQQCIKRTVSLAKGRHLASVDASGTSNILMEVSGSGPRPSVGGVFHIHDATRGVRLRCRCADHKWGVSGKRSESRLVGLHLRPGRFYRTAIGMYLPLVGPIPRGRTHRA